MFKFQVQAKLFVCLAMVFAVPALAQNAAAQGNELWTARYHGSVAGSSDAAVAMAMDKTGNVYVAGKSAGVGTGIDYATVAYDAKGNQLWAARYNGPGNGNDIVNAIAVDSKAGHVYVTGQSASAGTGSDYATVAYDFSGNQVWVARYNGPIGGTFLGADAFMAADSKTGNVYVTGVTTPPSGGFPPSITTVAYDSSGNQLWVAFDIVSAPAPYTPTYAVPRAIAVDGASGNVYVTGGACLAAGGCGGDVLTAAYNNAGVPLWERHAIMGGIGGFSRGIGIAVGSTGNVYVEADDDTDGLGFVFVTLAYDSTGAELGEQFYQARPGADEIPSALALDSNTGNVYATGSRDATSTGSGFLTLARDSNGNQLWAATTTSAACCGSASSIAIDNGTGNVYVTGTVYAAPSQGSFETVAYDSKGNQLWAAQGDSGTANGIAVDSNSGNVYVTGQGLAAAGGSDFLTVAYSQAQDTTPPVTTASVSPAPNSNGWNNTNVTVTFNSADSEPNASGVKEIQYALVGAQTIGTQTVAGSTASVTITAEGATTLNFLGMDNAGNAEQTKALTVQIDKTPPVLSGMAAPGCSLWPAAGNMVTVATVSAADALSGLAAGSFQVTGSSNEPSDPSKPDVVITPNGSGGYSVQLRAARLGSGTGRVYTLQATATDLAGNTTTSTTTCTVPHDQGH